MGWTDRAIGWIAGTNGSDTEINGKLNSLELPYTRYFVPFSEP